MSEVTRHFTATTMIVRDGKVLLHRHPKQGLWLPPGGHLERDELPHEAAVREIEEETGLRLHLHSEAEGAAMSVDMDCLVVPQPAFILVEDINPFHQHIDFVYFARVPGCAEVDEEDLRRRGFSWFAPDDLVMDGVPQNVVVSTEQALRWERALAPAPPD